MEWIDSGKVICEAQSKLSVEGARSSSYLYIEH
jgi:hypothetical protein